MGIQKLKELRADATVCGQTREIYWNEEDGRFFVKGIASFPEAMDVLQALGRGGVAEMSDPLDQSNLEVRDAVKDLHKATQAGFVPTAAPITRPSSPPHKFDLPGEALGQQPVPPKEPSKSVQRRQEAQAPKAERPAETPTPTGQETAGTGSKAEAPTEDLSVFGTHTKLSEAVEEIRKRGHGTYESILAYCKRLQDLGDVSPPIDQYGAKLEERLKVHLSGKGIPVPA